VRLPRWLAPRRPDDDIDAEIASHVELATRDRIAHGESPADARRRALIELGSPLLVKERTRAVWAWTALEQVATDVQTGIRILWRAPGLSATAIVLIALVIGGNTTVFSMVHGVLAKPAPGVSADRLVTLGWIADGEEHPGCSYPDYLDVAAASRTVRPMFATAYDHLSVTTPDGTFAVRGAPVSTNYLDTLSIRPTLGRGFSEADGQAGAALVALVSDRFWRTHFDAAPDVVGRTMSVNGQIATIVGVLPASFQGIALNEGDDVWLPLAPYTQLGDRRPFLTDRRAPFVIAIGRLAPDVSLAEAQAELATIAARLPRDPKSRVRNRTIQLFPYSATAAGDSLVAQRGPWFLALFSIITALTLLIVCANVANLMLARAVVRAREMAVRQSFGASRTRIARIFVVEALALAIVAWGAAALFAVWTTRAIPQLIPPLDGSAGRIAFDFAPDWRVLAYAMALALVGTVIIAAAPAVRTCRQDLQPLLQAGGHGIVAGRSGVSAGLVVAQIALSLILLTAAGLAYRSLAALDASELGFDRTRLFLVTINTKAAAPTPRANAALLSAMLERLRAVPGVTSVSYAHRPIQSYWPAVPVGGDEQKTMAERNEVGPGYFAAMGVLPRVGRDIADDDSDDAAGAIINQHLADWLWPAQIPIGRTLAVPGVSRPVVVTGVVPDGFYNGYHREANPNFVLVSASQAPPAPGEVTLYVKYSGALDAIVPAVGRALRAVDEHAPIVYQRTLDEQLEGLTWPIHALTVLLTAFAIGSLLIAAIGQYAAMSFTMRRRIRDFGVRMALGASSREIVRSVLVEGLRLTATGLAIGVALSVAVGRSLQSLLHGVRPTDAPTYAAVVGLLAAASLLACYLPAHRAARIDPMQALRQE